MEKRRKFIKDIVLGATGLAVGAPMLAGARDTSLNSGHMNKGFSFAFFTDLHLNRNPKSRTFEALKLAVKKAESSKIDFIWTGGDNVDADGMNLNQKEELKGVFSEFKSITDTSKVPWHLTIGNHDRYWGEDPQHVTDGAGMFSTYFGKTYYDFEHKGWHFITLNSVEIVDRKYAVGDVQFSWLENLLKQIPKDRPIVVSTHVPFLSLYYPVLEGRFTDTDTVSNQKKIWDLFKEYNLKLVLQGHQHLYEEIKVKGVQFITAGAICGGWWHGDFHGTQEGYLKVDIKGDQFVWEYIDYGWNPLKSKE